MGSSPIRTRTSPDSPRVSRPARRASRRLTLFIPSADCVTAISPDLKNQSRSSRACSRPISPATLRSWKAGTLSYALGADYREDSYAFKPDNLSQNQNFIDPIAGLFPNQNSGGEYDVKELYGELLIPIVSNGPKIVEHFNVELGARISDWSMEGVGTLDSYKALIDWGFTQKYRLRGGINKAHRAPNLSELFTERTQLFGGAPSVVGDQCAEAQFVGTVQRQRRGRGRRASGPDEGDLRVAHGPSRREHLLHPRVQGNAAANGRHRHPESARQSGSDRGRRRHVDDRRRHEPAREVDADGRLLHDRDQEDDRARGVSTPCTGVV